MRFKGNQVFVEVDEAGIPILENGRARMKYKLDTERSYSPNPNNLTEIDGTQPAQPPDTESAQPMPEPSVPQPQVTKQCGKDACIVAYTDGSCSGNPGPAGIGYVVTFPDGTCIQRGEPLGRGTNNIAELTAIQKVLNLVGDSAGSLIIHTDSEYAIGVLTRGWKAKANQQLIYDIKNTLSRFDNVQLKKVKGHAGVPENELVDKLARTAAETQSLV